MALKLSFKTPSQAIFLFFHAIFDVSWLGVSIADPESAAPGLDPEATRIFSLNIFIHFLSSKNFDNHFYIFSES